MGSRFPKENTRYNLSPGQYIPPFFLIGTPANTKNVNGMGLLVRGNPWAGYPQGSLSCFRQNLSSAYLGTIL